MSLTQADLAAIDALLTDSQAGLTAVLIARIDKLEVSLSRQLERGLQEIRQEFGGL